MCFSENSAIDDQLSRQPEGGGPGQPIRTTPDTATAHLWKVWLWPCTCPPAEGQRQPLRVAAGQISDWPGDQRTLRTWSEFR